MSTMLKPSGCIGCPFYDKGKYFVPDTIVPGSRVLFVAQNPGADEEAGQQLLKRHWYGSQYTDETADVPPQPLIGATGQAFNTRFLPLTALKRHEVSLANAIRCRPGSALGLKANELPDLTSKMSLETSKADIVKALKHCRDTYLQVPSSVELIVTMGRYAMFQLTGIKHEEDNIERAGVVESWRGYAVDLEGYSRWKPVDTTYYHPLTSRYKALFTMHIAALFEGRNKRYLHATFSDFHKVRLILNGKWPQSLPQYSTVAPVTWPIYSSFDTEYTIDTNSLIRWSLCDTDYRIYCVEADNTPMSGIPIRSASTVLMQNALADIGHLQSIVDKIHLAKLEDMMLAHSVLWTGEPHSLNYIASMYGPLNRHKHLSGSQEQLYSALDAYVPMHMWRSHFIPEFQADKESWQVYKKYRLPLINIINKAQQTGVKLDTRQLRHIKAVIEERLQQYREEAEEITGQKGFKLGGYKAMRERIYE